MLCRGPLRETPYACGSARDRSVMPEEVVGLVEATSYEAHNLWLLSWAMGGEGYYGKNYLRSWEQCSMGFWSKIGELAGRPVCVSVEYSRINGFWIGFWTPTSQVVDTLMIEAWLKKTFPNVRSTSDAGNFHNCISGLER